MGSSQFSRSRQIGIIAIIAALGGMVHAQPDPAYVPPKGGYDTPGTFAYKFDAVGETYERTLG